MRLIDADKIPWRRDYVSDDNMMMEHVVSKGDVDVMPTVDPVRHAHWMEKYVGGMFLWKCSICNAHAIIKSNYCPNCGARMDKVTE